MIADIFGANALTESNRMGIAEGRARDAERACPRSPDLTTSSEDSFSICDSRPNMTKMHVHLGR